MSALSSSAQTRNNKRSFGCSSRMVQSLSSTTNSMTTTSTPDPDALSLLSRQRQSKKDEVIRKKIEHELSRKKYQRGATRGATRQQQHKRIAGTVSALKPALALTVKETTLVMEAAQLMAAKRRDCILVVDDKEHLCGIFTAKDLAYRVIASHVDPRSTTVAAIMTKGPMCVTSDMSAHDALQLMVTRGFRHLPVCNDDADIFGLLDINKCVYDALDKMERAYGSSQKLYDALESVEREWPASNNSSSQFAQHMQVLRHRMSCPDLATVVDDHRRMGPPVQVSIKAQVRNVARMMKAYRTTAALVMDHGEVAGIFTTKDIVLRVIAPGLNPDNCSVVRVMTPHPDIVTPSISILDALKKMHRGRYLNLPVVDEDRNLIDMVDVLRLTRAALAQISDIKTQCPGDMNASGTKWFWSTIAAMSDSVTTEQDALLLSETLSARTFEPPSTPQLSDARHPNAFQHGLVYSLQPSIDPTATPPTSSSDDDVRSVISSLSTTQATTSTAQFHHATTLATTFSFKFSDGPKTYRFRCDYTNFAALKETVRQKFSGASTSADLTITYRDDEDDQVFITCNADLLDAVEVARKAGEDLVRLIVKVEGEEDRFLPEVPDEDEQDPDRTVTGDDPMLLLKEGVQPHDGYRSFSILPSTRKEQTVAPCSDGVPLDSGCIVNDEAESSWIADQMVLPATITFLGMAIFGAFTL